MTPVSIRRAGPGDARQMAELLNEIIAKGGTTALTTPVTRGSMAEWMEGGVRDIWHVAETDAGEILGFQWVEPDDQDVSCAHIATFARVGRTGLGIGSALFEATRAACVVAGYTWINANIRADNEGGLIYYQSRGFETYGARKNQKLSDGSVVDKVLKRYDL